VFLFSYGSNHPDQIAQRLGHPAITEGAFATGYERVFCGISQRWRGGVASLRSAKGASTFGLVTLVNKRDLALMDQYEGVASGNYERKKIQVHIVNRGVVTAYVYVSLSKNFTPPSREYLEAVAKTVGTHWRNDDGSKPTWRDITVRPCSGSARPNPANDDDDETDEEREERELRQKDEDAWDDELKNSSRFHGFEVPEGIRCFVSDHKYKRFADVNASEQGYTSKPRGLWYACGDEWVRWLKFNMPDWYNGARYLYEIKIDPSKMLMVNDHRKLQALDRIAGKVRSDIVDFGHGSGNNVVNWAVVAKEYGGVEICPRMGGPSWTGTWDVASGCVWSSEALVDVRLLHERPKAEMIESLKKLRKKASKKRAQSKRWREEYEAEKAARKPGEQSLGGF